MPADNSNTNDGTQDTLVEHTRAWTGLWVVLFGDIAIALAAILGVIKVSSSSANVPAMVSILTSAFTAVGTMTTAYFGIRAVSNTAQQSIQQNPTPAPVGPAAPAAPPGPAAPVGPSAAPTS
jgi:hypothetical protein